MNLSNQYFNNIFNLLQEIQKEESDKISFAAQKVAEATSAGGIIHLFGSGHSVLSALEVFMRAGGFSNSKPVVKELEIDRYERIPGVGNALMKTFDGRPGEVLFIFSNSGKNPLPLEVARCAKDKGVFTIGITSFEHAARGRKDGEVLADIVDLAIDNHVPYGDASVVIPGSQKKTGPLSTIANVATLHAIYCGATEKLVEMHYEPPVRISRNTPEGFEYNRNFVKKYGDRIPELRY